MTIIDLLVTIVVVTILVTIVLAMVTYVAYKLRLSREPKREEDVGGLQYFVDFRPRRSGAHATVTSGTGGNAATS
jgi:heme/copper-type cytochrome/quinol oxidase subunit 2